MRGMHRPKLGDRDRSLTEQLQQERLEVVVGAIDLVNEQYRGSRTGMP
jgi:hypothetical protein